AASERGGELPQLGGGLVGLIASTKPPLNEAENLLSAPSTPSGLTSFNEAASERGGEHRGPQRGDRDGRCASTKPPLNEAENLVQLEPRFEEHPHASTKPPLNEAENTSKRRCKRSAGRCFNEAASERGGERRGRGDLPGPPPAATK